MKLALIGFLLFPYLLFSQVQEFTLTGTLQNDISQTANCGIFIFDLPGKFNIISYSDSSYLNKEIVVLFFCPNEYKNPKLKKGKIIHLK